MPETNDGPCAKCDDSGFVETHSGGFWTGESMKSRISICSCACGDDIVRERAERMAATRTDADEIARPRCGCPTATIERVIRDHGTCGMGGCPYGGDF